MSPQRLTEQDHFWRSISEKAFQAQVLHLAGLLGWETLHVRHAPEVKRGASGAVVTRYTTPIMGSLGKGWPDLFLIHGQSGRILFAELKSEVGRLSPEQKAVLDILRLSTCDVFVWRPSDIDAIERILRRK